MKFTRVFTEPNIAVETQITWKRCDSKILDTAGTTIFEMKDIEVPAHWSETAINILAQKYFRKAGVPDVLIPSSGRNSDVPYWLIPRMAKPGCSFGPETSAKSVFTRLAGAWTYWGWQEGVFETNEDSAKVFFDELYFMLAQQIAAPNSPQWFNTGLFWSYGIRGPDSGQWTIDWNDETHPVVRVFDSYSRPAVHACYIQPVNDDLVNPGGIMDLWTREVRLFKHGSGTGSNFSAIRAKGEPLSGGGVSSGLMSFLKIGDSAAGAIKSGGVCLAPNQHVYTEHGPVEVQKLALRDSFIVLSYDPPANRYKAKRARAWKAGIKNIVRVNTDKGASFKVSLDHPCKLSDGQFIEAGNLSPGMSLFACSIDMPRERHLRINLRNGRKGKELWHRMIAADILGWQIDGMTVHHIDENILNNEPSNLEVKTQAQHAREHGMELASKGIHIFQQRVFPKAGAANGMHSESNFWQNKSKVNAYKQKQSDILYIRGDAAELQYSAASQKMLNTVFKVLNMGGDISTIEAYMNSRETLIGRIANRKKIRSAVTNRFGNWEKLLQEMNTLNHRVVSLTFLGESEVYDVEVDCSTADDKSPTTGHNFVIWPNAEYTGSGICVANTRRAAKMCVLDLDHPEIEDFINWKVVEENKARALVEAGYSEIEALETISGQNSNNSVRVPDVFLDTIDADANWTLHNRTDNSESKTLRASALWHQICSAAWACGDPGVQFHDTINKWNTCSEDGVIYSSNPCGEYLFLDNTACNLASLNLVMFAPLDSNRIFDCKTFEHAVRLWTIVLDISVHMASFPSEEIAEGTKNYRTLGLGYANLGSLLMRNAIPYDSDEGRSVAAAITALMNAVALRTSAELAAELGAFPRFEANKEPMLEVMEMHHEKLNDIDNFSLVSDIAIKALEAGREVLEAHEFRNAQVTLIAPTGTIGLLMDCDTTGIEPDFSLVKSKLLAGGGTMKLINTAVRPALEKLSYDTSAIEAIASHIESAGSIFGAPGLNVSDLSVFSCSVGPDALAPEAHVRMVAAVQPFLSGGISKTVNMSAIATIEDIDQIYRLAHQLGLKSVSVYRDGCKLSQPLSSSVVEKLWSNPTNIRTIYPDASETKIIYPRSSRISLPTRRSGYTQKVHVGGMTLYERTGEYPDGSLGEIFIDISEEGSTLRSFANSLAKAVSIGLQFGVPLSEFVDAFSRTQFEPAGVVEGHETIKICSSIISLIFRDLGITYLGQKELGNVTQTATEAPVVSELSHKKSAGVISGDPCPRCGNLLLQTGTCKTCSNCEFNSGCG